MVPSLHQPSPYTLYAHSYPTHKITPHHCVQRMHCYYICLPFKHPAYVYDECVCVSVCVRKKTLCSVLFNTICGLELERRTSGVNGKDSVHLCMYMYALHTILSPSLPHLSSLPSFYLVLLSTYWKLYQLEFAVLVSAHSTLWTHASTQSDLQRRAV